MLAAHRLYRTLIYSYISFVIPLRFSFYIEKSNHFLTASACKKIVAWHDVCALFSGIYLLNKMKYYEKDFSFITARLYFFDV